MSKSQPYNYFYPIKVWLLTILLSSLILYTFLVGDKFIESIILYFIMILLGLILSLPSLLLYCLLYYSLNKTDINVRRLKLIMIISGISFIYITFYVVGGRSLLEWKFPLSYSVVFIAVTLLTKMKVINKE